MIDILGKKFTKLLVIEIQDKKLIGGTKRNMCLCRCDCGNLASVQRQHLISGNTKSCGCYKHERPSYNNKYVGKMSGCYWGSVVASAKHRGIPFDLKATDAWNVFLKQNSKCCISNIELSFTQNKTWQELQSLSKIYQVSVKKLSKRVSHIVGNASLDRINNNVGYTIDNIQWVDKTVNRLKHINSDNEFIFLCHLINKKLLIHYYDQLDGVDIQWSGFVSRCRKKHDIWQLNVDEIQKILYTQKYRCFFTGIRLAFGKNHVVTTASLDRINSKNGCIPGNVQFVHKRINMMKSNMSNDEFINWCKIISDFQLQKCGIILPGKEIISNLVGNAAIISSP